MDELEKIINTTMRGEGPYREMHSSETKKLEKMRKQIEDEKAGLSLELPENAKAGDTIEHFKSAQPEDIVFYSLATGILRYEPRNTDSAANIFYDYYNKENRSVYLTVQAEKNNPAEIFIIHTKAEAGQLENEGEENQRKELFRVFNELAKNIRQIEKLIETGVNGEDLNRTLTEELEDAKKILERFLFKIQDKLRPEKK